ncbi:GNAT family N-acetyltransferase [Candidatus Bipolaricaulota bacterium]|nr:GNAT family N-acetyltransferase [Candidatus Bipolaricaulota bacterium]
MRVCATTYQTAGEFLGRTQAVLEEREAENSLMLGLCLRMNRFPEQIKNAPYFVTVERGEELLVAAIMTPPHKLVIYADSPDRGEAFHLIVQDLLANHWRAPGVLGAPPVAEGFARAWADVTGERVTQGMRQRVYALTQVNPPRVTHGSLRVAKKADLPLLTQWTLAFHHEAVPNNPLSDVEELVRRKTEQAEIVIWEDGNPVSMAARARPTANGVAVNLVYTPPEQRRKGYASACVASLSQRLLDSGFKFCCLFTDLANPVSNSLYKKIGYNPVCDFTEYIFTAAT